MLHHILQFVQQNPELGFVGVLLAALGFTGYAASGGRTN